MGKFDGILIATDIDGTLVADGKISKENADAIRYFQTEGGLFTLATGRYITHIRENYAKDIDTSVCILTLNGNLLCYMNSDDCIKISQMDKAKTEEVLNYSLGKFADKILFINVCDSDCAYVFEGSVANEPCKCVFVLGDEDSALALRDDLRENFSHIYNIERSWPTGVEIYDIKGGKGNAINYIRKTLHPEVKTVICVGDHENDVTMLKAADIGYAVQNATDEAKAAADFVIDADNTQHAIARIIDRLESQNN